MSAKVEVLCPNGHRVTMKVTPNTTILQILEEVCHKKNFLPSDVYELRHGKRTLDVTLSFRFANLPNLAKLDLVKAAKLRSEDEVSVTFHLENGKRLHHVFSPSSSLWDVVLHWQDSDKSSEKGQVLQIGRQPCCVYIREEILGEYALRNTSLRSLGLTSGSAIIRFDHRDNVTEETLSQIRDKIDHEQGRQRRLLNRNVSNESSSELSYSNSHAGLSQNNTASSLTLAQTVAMDTVSNDNQAHSFGTFSDVRSTVPVDDAVVCMSDSWGHFRMQVAPLSSGNDVVMRDELRVTEADVGNAKVVIRKEKEETIETVNQLQKLSQSMDCQTYHNSSTSSGATFVNFKFPEETKGQNLYKNELSEVNRDEYKPCDRQMVLYNRDLTAASSLSHTAEEVPDDFFDITETDLRLQMADLQKKAKADSENMLMTQAMRKALWEERFAVYDRVILRIQFPDHMVVQGVFRPRETVYNVQKFVRELLQEKNAAFYLYTTPPRTVLSDSSLTLIEAKLVPMSVIYFGIDAKTVKSSQYLSSSVLESLSSLQEANNIVMTIMSQGQSANVSSKGGGGASSSSSDSVGHSGTSYHVAAALSAAQSNSDQQTSTSRTTTSVDPGQKVPKWFKAGLINLVFLLLVVY